MRRWAKLIGWVVFFGLATVVGAISDDQKLLTIAIQVMMLGALASSWNILGGFAGQISLGHATFFGLGALVAQRCLEHGIKQVVFDRNGFLYHGRIRAVAEGAREGGLEF